MNIGFPGFIDIAGIPGILVHYDHLIGIGPVSSGILSLTYGYRSTGHIDIAGIPGILVHYDHLIGIGTVSPGILSQAYEYRSSRLH